MKTIFIKTAFLALFLTVLSISGSCKKDDSSSGPEIVGCNSVKYQEYTFSNIGCAVGISSFDIEITQNGHYAHFHITCSGGCVSSVTNLK
jgi:hypothetical protein